jgi:hypothetical protein
MANEFVQKDSTIKKEKLIQTKGNIGLGYDYGVLPFVVANPNSPGYFKTEGQVQVTVKSLPFNSQFYYSSLKNISGLNNYFRVSFDAEQFKQNYLKSIDTKKGSIKTKINELYKAKQYATKQLQNYQHKLNTYKPNDNFDSIPNLLEFQLKDSISYNVPSLEIPDSVSKDFLPDSLPTKPELPQLSVDSLYANIDHYNSLLDKINSKISELENTLELAKNTSISPAVIFPENKFLNALMAVKKMDLGLCYPSHSTFLVNGIAIKGINLELERKNYFFAFTYGKTINNLLYSNNLVQNNLQNAQNLFNFFDFNNVTGGRRITALKIGLGAKEANHFHIGLANGIGQTSYFNSSDSASITTQSGIEKNWVMELDGKLLIKKSIIIDATYGKSALQSSTISDPDQFESSNKLFNWNDRSNAALLKLTSRIVKTGTKLTATARLIDPFFRSFGVGFIRSDNFRYEFKAEQDISKKLKINASYRREQDNLLNLFYTQNTLQTFGAGLSYKPNRSINFRAGYNPVLQQINIEGEENAMHNNSNISFVVLNYTPQLDKIKLSFTALFNYYNISNSNANSNFSNLCLISNSTIKKTQHTLSFNAFYTNASDSLTGNTLLAAYELKIPASKKINTSITAKWADNTFAGNQWGYALKINYNIHKNISWELSGEKLIYGDFYNSIGLNRINNFPYYCYTKLLIHW